MVVLTVVASVTLATTVSSVQLAPLSKATRAGLVDALAQPGGHVSSCSRSSFSNARLLPAACVTCKARDTPVGRTKGTAVAESPGGASAAGTSSAPGF